jgi:2-polyprenyl-6-methoxyphenol hydroxylase-like FAD-dependent oxidoreductase
MGRVSRDGSISLCLMNGNHSFQAGWLCHRTDLHDELKRLAVGEDGAGPLAKLNLGQEVASCDPVAGTLTLKNGEVHQADLIIGADGIHVRLLSPIAFTSKLNSR